MRSYYSIPGRGMFAAALASLGLIAGCADTGDLLTSGSTAATSASTTAEANDFASARQFEKTRHVALRRDVAAGQGEDLDAFAQLMHAQDAEQFSRWMQANYAELYPASSKPGELVDRVVALRATDETPIRRASR